ncbi:electron transport complex subunit D, partial [Klebsiella pneumoniae]
PRRWTPRPPNRSTRARRRWKPPSPAPKRVKPNSRPHNRISRQPQPMTTRAKRPSPRLSPAFRRVKQHSRQLTRNKWFSESQAPPIPITSGRPRVLCCWCCSPLCLALWSRPGFSAGAPYCRLSSPP